MPIPDQDPTARAKNLIDSMVQVANAPAAARLAAEPRWRCAFVAGPADKPELKVEAVYQWEVMGFLVPEPPMAPEKWRPT